MLVSPVQIGCTECTIFELLEQHRKEVVAVKEQIWYVKEKISVTKKRDIA